MTVAERETCIKKIHEFESNLLSAKGKDYSGGEDVLRNFKINAERLGLTKYQVLTIYLMKHIDAILNAIQDNPHAPKRETDSIIGSIVDGRNYLGLLFCLIAEDRKQEEEKGGAASPPPCQHEWTPRISSHTSMGEICINCGQKR